MKRAVFCALVGALASTVIGVGVNAAIDDSVVSNGNRIASSPFAEADVDLLVGRLDRPPATCSPTHVDYHDDAVGAMTLGTELDLQGPGISQRDQFCVRNAGRRAALVSVVFDAVTERELGPCSTGEAGAGDDSCTDGAAGELAGVVEVSVSVQGPDCVGATASFLALTGEPVALGSVRAGKSCLVRFSFAPIGDDDARRRAQTDQIDFDVRFGLTAMS